MNIEVVVEDECTGEYVYLSLEFRGNEVPSEAT